MRGQRVSVDLFVNVVHLVPHYGVYVANYGVVVEEQKGVQFLDLSVSQKSGENVILQKDDSEVVVYVADYFSVVNSQIVVKTRKLSEKAFQIETYVLVFIQVGQTTKEILEMLVVDQCQSYVRLLVD